MKGASEESENENSGNELTQKCNAETNRLRRERRESETASRRGREKEEEDFGT